MVASYAPQYHSVLTQNLTQISRKKRPYVRQIGNTLGFNRHFPPHQQSITINKQFTYPMGRADQSEVAIDRDYANAKEACAAECERASNSNTDSFNDAKI